MYAAILYARDVVSESFSREKQKSQRNDSGKRELVARVRLRFTAPLHRSIGTTILQRLYGVARIAIRALRETMSIDIATTLKKKKIIY